jgi:hypothetical protein
VSSGPSGAYAEKVFGWTPDLPIPVLTGIESDYTGYYEDATATYDTYYDLAIASGYGSGETNLVRAL